MNDAVKTTDVKLSDGQIFTSDELHKRRHIARVYVDSVEIDVVKSVERIGDKVWIVKYATNPPSLNSNDELEYEIIEAPYDSISIIEYS